MGRVAKFLRSRFFLGTVCILLELLQLWAIYLWLYEIFLPLSLVHHFECGVWMCGTDCIPAMEQDFAKMLKVSREIMPDKIVLTGWQRLLAGFLKILSPLL